MDVGRDCIDLGVLQHNWQMHDRCGTSDWCLARAAPMKDTWKRMCVALMAEAPFMVVMMEAGSD